ncbi:MAG: protein translocase subunit SecDF [Bacteroidales bacterium]|nr:protein translocase subunit SecDF [Bacteroidales bacterium]
MRNKGAIWTLAVALALVCIYQLSFTFVTYKVRKDANKYALKVTNNTVGKLDSLGAKIADHYLDSIASEEVYNFLWLKKYTYRECQEREINLGLDLRGGMNVILEISTVDVLRSLANYSKDTTFNRALAIAQDQMKSSNEDFVTLFGRAFESVDPNAQLGSIFTAQELRNEISYNTSNDEVLRILREKANDAISNSFEIIRTRIDHFGVAQPNVQRIEGGDRILVELPGVEEKERVRNLLQGTARLEFWETYENSEIVQSLIEANNMIREINQDSKTLAEQSSPEPVTGTVTGDTSATEGDEELSLLEKIEADTSAVSDSLAEEAMGEEMPLFVVLKPNVTQNWEPLPGSVFGRVHYKDTAKTNQYLQLAIQKGIFPSDFKYLWSAKPILDPETRKPTDYYELHAIKITGREGRPPLTGDVVTQAQMQFDQVDGSAGVSMSMDANGATAWARITRENVGRCIAIVMDDYVYSSPRVNEEIKGGSSSITGSFDTKEATDLANLLKSGTMPAPAKIVQEEVIGPSLGKQSVTSGLKAFLYAFIAIWLFMIFYYSRKAGLVANIALLCNIFFLIGVLASLQLALTLPGIAGIVLTLGMAVDANVLIFERIREEVLAGKGIRLAVADGYKNALSAIIDGNVTTLLTGIILFVLGTGPVKGFATTLVIGICTSLFTAIFLSRLIFEMYLEKNVTLTFATKSTEGFLKNVNFDYLKNRKVFYVISVAIIIIGTVSLFTRGLDAGVDFSGGRNFIIQFDKTVNNIEIGDKLEPLLDARPTVITFGSSDKVRITTKYKIDSDDSGVDEEIQQLLYQGLQSYLPENTSYENFSANNVQSIQKIGPTIADDIKRQSSWALLVAVIMMFLYIFMRFRNWRYGLGATVATFHDSFVVVALFSILYGFMPFSMEIDQAFIAAILTVIGYSVNDTVVVFDRIREFITLHPKRNRSELMNAAINSTLSRTLITSVTTLLTILILFLVAGESIRGFTFAMFIGVIIGTYSTIFIATPVVYDTLKKKTK